MHAWELGRFSALSLSLSSNLRCWQEASLQRDSDSQGDIYIARYLAAHRQWPTKEAPTSDYLTVANWWPQTVGVHIVRRTILTSAFRLMVYHNGAKLQTERFLWRGSFSWTRLLYKLNLQIKCFEFYSVVRWHGAPYNGAALRSFKRKWWERFASFEVVRTL